MTEKRTNDAGWTNVPYDFFGAAPESVPPAAVDLRAPVLLKDRGFRLVDELR